MTIDPTAVARELADAEREGRWVPLLSERFDDLDWAGARAVARARDELRHREGDRIVGYKLGWTSRAMREALGIASPNWGTLWASQVIDDELDATRLHQAKVEPELVAEVDGDGVPRRWALGLEVVNPRFESYRFDWLDNTADNSSCARIRMGTWTTLDDPAEVEVHFEDGRELRSGAGSAVDGGPDGAVAWLGAQLATEGTALRAGDIVFTGGLTAPSDAMVGQLLRVRSPTHPELGVVSSTPVIRPGEPPPTARPG